MTTDKEHLQWIHDRIIEVYGESENVDFLIRMRKIIDKQNNELNLHSVRYCASTLEDTIDLIEHTSRVLDAYKEKGIAMKVLDKRVKSKLNYLHKLYSR